jgi:hypothetical protein
MQYKSSDRGPYYLSIEERERQRHDRPTGKTLTENKTKDMILNNLKESSIHVIGTVVQLKEIARRNNIPVIFDMQEIIKGWEGQPKGMLQVLWERGFVDGSQSEKHYTIEGRKDQVGNIDPETSVKMMMQRQMDFIEEETLLQYHGRQLGVVIHRTPKCHPEMAGEGIEYNWGCAKGYYRRLPIMEKQTKTKFRESVKKSISREIITTERQRMFSQRARQYMLAYNAIDYKNTDNSKQPNEATTAANTTTDKKKTTFAMIESIIKNYKQTNKTHRSATDTYKTHRSVADSECSYINNVVSAMKMASFMHECQPKTSVEAEEEQQQ